MTSAITPNFTASYLFPIAFRFVVAEGFGVETVITTVWYLRSNAPSPDFGVFVGVANV